MPIGRSATGTYHHCAGGSSACNGRSFRGGRTVTKETIERAPEDMFCNKCFIINKRDKTRKGNALFILEFER